MADLKSSPEELVATLGAEMEAAKADYLADRDNADKAARLDALMTEYTDARRQWRAVGEYDGSRTVGANVRNNVDSNGA